MSEGKNYEDSLKLSRKFSLPHFYWECETHGLTFHSGRKGDCLACRQVRTPRGDVNRVAARRLQRRFFPAICETHGVQAFSTAAGRCMHCCNIVGYARLRPERGLPDSTELFKRDGYTPTELVRIEAMRQNSA